MLRRRQWHPTPVLLPGKSHGWRSLEGCSSWSRWGLYMTERLHFHALEKEMATHSSILAWRIPGTGEPGGLPSMGSHRVGHNWSNLAAAAAAFGNKYTEHLLDFNSFLPSYFPPFLSPFQSSPLLPCVRLVLWSHGDDNTKLLFSQSQFSGDSI